MITSLAPERCFLVAADLSGILFGSAQIFLFVLAVGAFVTVTMKTGAIQTGIGRLAMGRRKRQAQRQAQCTACSTGLTVSCSLFTVKR